MADEYVVSVVLEGDSNSLTNATDRGSRSQKNLKKSTDDANLAFLAQVARYQAMTAALNQTIGGLNKLAGGLEAIGFEKTAESTRKFTKLLELFAGPAEIYLAYLTLTIALGQKDVATKGAQTTATGILTTAQMKLNAAMAMNPLVIIAVAIVVLLVALYALEKRFGFVTKQIDKLNNALQTMDEFLGRIRDGWKGVEVGMKRVSDLISGRALSRLLRGGRV